jgi:hypothetical protein
MYTLNNPYLDNSIREKKFISYKAAKKAAQQYANEYNLIIGITPKLYKCDGCEKIRNKKRNELCSNCYAILKSLEMLTTGIASLCIHKGKLCRINN